MQQELLHIGEIHDRPFPETHSFLKVISCGAHRVIDRPYRVIRNKGRKDFHILYAESGSFRVFFEGKYQNLHPGQYVLYYPGQRQEYHFSAKAPFVDCWVHFHGTSAYSILSDCSLESGIYAAPNPTETERQFHRLARALHPTSGATETKKNNLLLSVLCSLSAESNHADTPESVQKAVHYLHANYASSIEIAELAKVNNLSPSRFQHVFKTHMGTSPHQYLLSLRIEHAKELLSTDNLSVAAISTMVGFEDAFYFSRIFKKITGVSPSVFRKHNIS